MRSGRIPALILRALIRVAEIPRWLVVYAFDHRHVVAPQIRNMRFESEPADSSDKGPVAQERSCAKSQSGKARAK